MTKKQKPKLKLKDGASRQYGYKRQIDTGLEDDDDHAIPGGNNVMAFGSTWRPGPTQAIYTRKFSFEAGSTTRKISPLYGTEERLRYPRVMYAPDVWDMMWYIIDVCPQEVGWLGLVDKVGDDYLITKIWVPEQTVSGAETDIGPEAMTDLALELLSEGLDSSKLYYWGHSHVNMAVGPSSQDERQVDEYLEQLPVVIRGIYNKRRDTKVDVFDRERHVVFQAVENGIQTPGMTEGEEAGLRTLLMNNVRERRFHGNGAGSYYQGPRSTPSTIVDKDDFDPNQVEMTGFY